MRAARRSAHTAACPLAFALALGACATDHDPDRPGPPRVIHAYVVEASYGADGTATYLGLLTDPSFDPTDPEVWRKVPDLTQGGAAGPYAPPTLLRAVLSELVEGDALEDLTTDADGDLHATLRPGVIAVSAVPRNPAIVPTSAAAAPMQASYFDPSGSGTTGPPGPALVMAPSPTLPAGSTVTVTLSGAAIKDTAGHAMGADATFTFETSDVAPMSVNGARVPAAATDIEQPAGKAIEIVWNTLLLATTVVPAAFELRGPLADAMPAVVPVDVSYPMGVAEALGGVPSVTLKPRAPLAAGGRYALTLRASLTDLFAVPLPADVTLTLVAK